MKTGLLKVCSLGLAFFVVIITSFLFSYTHNYFIDNLQSDSYFLKWSIHLKRLVNLPARPCSCSSCVAEHSHSPWFEKRFNESIPHLLTKQNSKIPDDVFRWWRKLQMDPKPRPFNETISQLFETISGDYVFPEISPYKCRRCAVVGNAGNLRDSGYGRWIDSHELVLRMNKAVTVGYEVDVGSKTTHQFIYPESAFNLHENATIILIPYKILDLEWIISALTTGKINQTYARVPRKINVRKDKIAIFNPTFMNYVHFNWMENHGVYPSTGIMCIIFALHVCDQVDVYGFGAHNNGIYEHYYEKKGTGIRIFQEEIGHDWDFQTNVTESLRANNKIQFFSGA
ncbi:CMP-N-acetylneuraminate-beta-galactosamide-alpha-2,3-sialyltransferase 1-like isoform X1 [Lissotriton helveticus]